VKKAANSSVDWYFDCAEHWQQELKLLRAVPLQAARQIRFSDSRSIKRLRPALRSYILQAIEVENSGAKIAMKTASDFTVAEEFRRRLLEHRLF
jgi:hypothetical protein